MDETSQTSVMRQYNRMHLWEIWQKGRSGLPLEGEDARLYEVMEGHMQHARLWDRLNIASDDEIIQDGANLVLHITFHAIVENQLAEDDPPAVRQVLKVLMAKGMREHEAVHAIASAAAWEAYAVMKEKREFDVRSYVRELRKLPVKFDQARKARK